MLAVNTPAPSFLLYDQTNTLRSLENYKGKWLLIYFYPKDMTPGCTIEACSFRDNFDQLKNKVKVIGVSTDSVTSHQKFVNKHTLPFTLLSDADKQMVRAYDAFGKKKFMGREFEGTYRVSYLINPEGIIVKSYPKVNPKTHVQEVLKDLQMLQ